MRWEKKARLAMIHVVTRDVALEMLSLCYECKDWDSYRSSIVHISKRRQQHSSVIAKSVEVALTLVDKTPDRATKLKFVETLRDVTEGKIFLEVQRARLTRRLASMKEEDGEIDEASKIMQEVQVETYGTMDNAEKVEFILEQIRLCMVRKDWVRVAIIQKKIDRKAIDADDIQQLKLRFYDMICRMNAQNDDTLELARSHLAVYNTKSVKDKEQDWKRALSSAALFIVLSRHGKDQSDLLNRTKAMEAEKLKELELFQNLLKQFTTQEIIAWPFSKETQQVLSKHPVFSNVDMFGEKRVKEWTKRLRRRVLEHNVRVISGVYSRIRLTRLAEMIGLGAKEAESLVADMVSIDDDENSEPLYAKMDRPAGIVSFERPQSADAQMTEWASNINDVLELVEKTRHLIDRENQVAMESSS
jgi:26S proteasome regulatory subunit N5